MFKGHCYMIIYIFICYLKHNMHENRFIIIYLILIK